MKLSSAKRLRFVCCSIAISSSIFLAADYLIQTSPGRPFEASLLSLLFFIGMFPIFIGIFPWIATAVNNFYKTAPEAYKLAIQRGPTRKIAIEEYIKNRETTK